GDIELFNAFLHDIGDRRRAAMYVDAQRAVTRILAEVETEEEVIAGLLRELGERMGWEYGAFWRMDEERDRLVCARVWTIGGGRAACGGVLSPGDPWRSARGDRVLQQHDRPARRAIARGAGLDRQSGRAGARAGSLVRGRTGPARAVLVPRRGRCAARLLARLPAHAGAAGCAGCAEARRFVLDLPPRRAGQ